MNLEKMCKDIIKSDLEILMVAASYRMDSHYEEREGTKSLHTKKDVEKSLADAALRWVTRRSHRILGEPLYAMAKYEKAKRITVPLGRFGIILCAVMPDSDAEKIASKLIKAAKKYSD
jgi:hypothetical protein